MRAAVVAIAAIVAVVAVGCSSDDAADPAPTEPSTDVAVDEAPASTDDSIATSDPDSDPDSEPDSDPDETDDSGASGVPDKVEPARDAGEVDAPAGVQPEGFTTATVRVTSADGEVCEVCLWLADSGDERGRGLMGVTDLGPPAGMLFRFAGPTTGNFFMFGTPMPLSIAWFDEGGAHVAATDMEPCLVENSAACERYGPGAEYIDAIEMVQGELDVIGIGPGSTIEVLAEHDTCPDLR